MHDLHIAVIKSPIYYVYVEARHGAFGIVSSV